MSDDAVKLMRDARAARNDGQLELAERCYARAADLARRSQENFLLAHALRHISDIARERSKPIEALAAGQEAVAIYRTEADSSVLDLANALRLCALALQGLGKQYEARPL